MSRHQEYSRYTEQPNKPSNSPGCCSAVAVVGRRPAAAAGSSPAVVGTLVGTLADSPAEEGIPAAAGTPAAGTPVVGTPAAAGTIVVGSPYPAVAEEVVVKGGRTLRFPVMHMC